MILLESCKKTNELTVTGGENDQDLIQKFFNSSRATDPLVIKVADFIKTLQQKQPFVAEFARNNGMPRWDKAVISVEQNNSTLDSVYQAIGWGGLYRTPAFAANKDSMYIYAMNKMAKDTSTRSPFTLVGFPAIYYHDSHNLNFKQGCQ